MSRNSPPTRWVSAAGLAILLLTESAHAETVGTYPSQEVIDALRSDNVHVRVAAVEEFARNHAIPPRGAIPALVDALGETGEKNFVGEFSTDQLSVIGPDCVPDLLRRMGRGPIADERSMRILEYFGPAASPALPILIDIMKMAKGILAWRSAMLVLTVDPSVSESVPFLIPALRLSNDYDVRYKALKLLRKMGRRGRAAVPALVALMESREENQRREVIETLRSIGGPAEMSIAYQYQRKWLWENRREALLFVCIFAIPPALLAWGFYKGGIRARILITPILITLSIPFGMHLITFHETFENWAGNPSLNGVLDGVMGTLFWATEPFIVGLPLILLATFLTWVIVIFVLPWKGPSARSSSAERIGGTVALLLLVVVLAWMVWHGSPFIAFEH